MTHLAPRQSPADVLIAGAGVIGLAIGWRAAQAGLNVWIVEPREPGAGASGVAAGMLAPVTEADFGEQDLIRSNVQAAAAYPDFVAELEAETGIQTGYRPCGTLSVATDRDELELLERMHSLQLSLGLWAERLRASEARALEPGLATAITGAIHAPDDHQVSPRALLSALRTAFEAAGGRLRCGEGVQSVNVEGAVVTGATLASGERIAAANTVIAAGSWSGRIDGVELPVRPVKGQILRLRGDREHAVAQHVIRTPEIYAVPRDDGRLVIGATVEEQAFDTSVTAGAVLELLRRAYDVLPQIAELELVEIGAGLRPATPDNRPLVGPAAQDGLWWATGHWRNGVLQAPLTAERIVSALTGRAVPA